MKHLGGAVELPDRSGMWRRSLGILRREWALIGIVEYYIIAVTSQNPAGNCVLAHQNHGLHRRIDTFMTIGLHFPYMTRDISHRNWLLKQWLESPRLHDLY